VYPIPVFYGPGKLVMKRNSAVITYELFLFHYFKKQNNFYIGLHQKLSLAIAERCSSELWPILQWRTCLNYKEIPLEHISFRGAFTNESFS